MIKSKTFQGKERIARSVASMYPLSLYYVSDIIRKTELHFLPQSYDDIVYELGLTLALCFRCGNSGREVEGHSQGHRLGGSQHQTQRVQRVDRGCEKH